MRLAWIGGLVLVGVRYFFIWTVFGIVAFTLGVASPEIEMALASGLEHSYDRAVHALNDIKVSDGDIVASPLIARALTAGELVFSDHATQVFDADGGTTYVENGRPTRGEWYVDNDGHFGSFWPPSYRASYDLHWIVEDGTIVGLRFTELGRGTQFDGRYRD